MVCNRAVLRPDVGSSVVGVIVAALNRGILRPDVGKSVVGFVTVVFSDKCVI